MSVSDALPPQTVQRGLLGLGLFSAALLAACADTAVAPEEPAITPPSGTQSIGVVVIEDEIVLTGMLFGSEHEPLVVLSHMRSNDQTAWFSFAETLAENGYAALTYNFRGYADSGGSQDFDKLDEDLASILRFARDQGRTEIFLIGASMGGTASLVVAAQQDVNGVVSISSPAEFEGQDALGAVPNIDQPTLFIAAEDDTAAALSLDELFEAASDPKDSETYPGNAHGTMLFTSEHADAIGARILEFLEANRSN